MGAYICQIFIKYLSNIDKPLFCHSPQSYHCLFFLKCVVMQCDFNKKSHLYCMKRIKYKNVFDKLQLQCRITFSLKSCHSLQWCHCLSFQICELFSPGVLWRGVLSQTQRRAQPFPAKCRLTTKMSYFKLNCERWGFVFGVMVSIFVKDGTRYLSWQGVPDVLRWYLNWGPTRMGLL